MACFLGGASVQLREGREALRLAADDSERHRQAEPPGADRGLGRSADGDPDRQRILQRPRVYAEAVERRTVLSRPGHVLGLPQLEQELELLGEQLVVVDEVVTKSGNDSMNDPRPAMISARPPEMRSSAAKSWKTRTGSSELMMLTALVRRMFLVCSVAAASTTAGEETTKSVVLADAEDVEPELVRELDLFEQVANALGGRQRPSRRRVGRELSEGVDAERGGRLFLVVAALFALIAPATARADAVTDWNAIASTTIVVMAGQPPHASTSSFAMVQGAVYDAVNAIDGGHRPYLVQPAANPWDSKDAAAPAAAFKVLAGLFLGQLGTLQPLYDNYVAALPDDPPGSKAAGIAVGEAAATAMLKARENDGRNPPGPFPFVFGTDPGQWRLAPPQGPAPGIVAIDPAPWVGGRSSSPTRRCCAPIRRTRSRAARTPRTSTR